MPGYNRGDGCGDIHSYGNGFGYGDGYGDGFGYGVGDGLGYGYDDGFGYGYSSGYGSGWHTGGRRKEEPCGEHTTEYWPEWSLLKVGYEIHTLADWLANADEINAEHDDGIAEKVRELAMRLKKSEGSADA
jgi:hypothetical protein